MDVIVQFLPLVQHHNKLTTCSLVKTYFFQKERIGQPKMPHACFQIMQQKKWFVLSINCKYIYVIKVKKYWSLLNHKTSVKTMEKTERYYGKKSPSTLFRYFIVCCCFVTIRLSKNVMVKQNISSFAVHLLSSCLSFR